MIDIQLKNKHKQGGFLHLSFRSILFIYLIATGSVGLLTYLSR